MIKPHRLYLTMATMLSVQLAAIIAPAYAGVLMLTALAPEFSLSTAGLITQICIWAAAVGVRRHILAGALIAYNKTMNAKLTVPLLLSKLMGVAPHVVERLGKR